MTSSSAASPASWPLVRGSPRCLAQRPLPSMTIATWRGTRSGGISGGLAPDGCGGGGCTGVRRATPATLATFGCAAQRWLRKSGAVDQRQRPQSPLEMPLQVRRGHPARLAPVPGVAAVDGDPVTGQQGGEQGEGLGGGGDRSGRAAAGTDDTARRDVEERVRPGPTAAGALVEGRGVTGHSEGPQEE